MFNILLIEMDQSNIYFSNKDEFITENERWTVISNVVDVNNKLENAVFDIVLLDCNHLDINTANICKSIREQEGEQDTSIVYLSSESTLEQRLKAYDVGVDDFLQKSIPSSELRVKLNICKEHHSKRRQLIAAHEKQNLETIQNVSYANSDISSLLSLCRGCLNVHTVDKLGNELKVALESFNLSFSLQILTPTEYFHLRDDGNDFSAVEIALFQSLKESSHNIQNFGGKSYFHDGDVELVIHNMPVDDVSLYGRLKDLLHLYLGVVNDKNTILGVLSNAQHLCQKIIEELENKDISDTALKLNELKELIHSQDILDNDLQEDIVFF